MPDADGNARPILSGKDTSRGMIDFAGSGVVHMVGGVAGLMGVIVVGLLGGEEVGVEGRCRVEGGRKRVGKDPSSGSCPHSCMLASLPSGDATMFAAAAMMRTSARAEMNTSGTIISSPCSEPRSGSDGSLV